jgi:hypothetical protein
MTVFVFKKEYTMNRFWLLAGFLLLSSFSCGLPMRYNSSLTAEHRAEDINKKYDIISGLIEEGRIQYVGGNGLSLKTAIIIQGVHNEDDGIAAEYVYLMQKHGIRNTDWKLIMQSTPTENGKVFDALQIEDIKNNNKIEYYFDITNFYGKY